jgi:penicillin-binding protein 1A
MTGGSLPAMTWHAVMESAHQGIELKPMPGLKEVGRPAAQAYRDPDSAAPVNAAASAAGKLSRRSFEVIGGLNGLFRAVEPSSAKSGIGNSGIGNSGVAKSGTANSGAAASGDVAEGARAVGGRIGIP